MQRRHEDREKKKSHQLSRRDCGFREKVNILNREMHNKLKSCIDYNYH